MSATLKSTTAARSDGRAGGVRRRITLDVGEGPDVLVRVLSLLRRRQCRILAVDFQETDRHGPGRFELTILAPRRSAHRLDAWLMGLVDVHAIGEPTQLTRVLG